jgi:hypothetical protein
MMTLAFLQIFSFLLQTATTAPTNLTTVSAEVMPLILIALMLDAVLIVIWYYFGVAMNNGRVKESAKGEFYQLIGTALMIAIIVGVLVLSSAAFYSAVSSTSTNLMNPTTISTLCTNIESSTQLDIIGNTNSILSGPVSGTGNFIGICSLVGAGQTDLTSKLDYPIAASAVVIANLTNQTAANLNYSFTYDAWIGFLSQVSPMLNLCIDPPTGIGCLVPNPIKAPIFIFSFTSTPYAGYNMLISNLQTFGALLNLSLQSFIAQMLIISMFIYLWPYLLFVGILLRSTFLTRRLGGLLIAAALVGLIVYPLIFSTEYLTLGNGFTASVTGASPANLNGYNTTYGFNTTTTLPGNNNGNYIINFFIEPNIKTIATTYQCWPTAGTGPGVAQTLTGGGLFKAEAIDIASLLLPVANIASALRLIFSSALSQTTAPLLLVPVSCSPNGALATFFALLNSYGLIGVISYFIPIINLIIMLTALIGLSGLFGGDTELAGLAKLI